MATKKINNTPTTLSANGRQRKAEAPKVEPKAEESPEREKLIISDNMRWVLCVVLFFASAFVTLAIVSHYFTWRADQMGGAATNSAGLLGLKIADFFVGDWFGIFALCIPAMGFLLSLRTSRDAKGFFGRMVKLILMVMVLGSVTFGFVTRADGAFGSGIGGKMGIDIAEWLSGYVGRFGLGLLLFMCWVLVAVYANSSRTIEAVNKMARKTVSLFKPNRSEGGDVVSEDDEEDDDELLKRIAREEANERFVVLQEDEEDEDAGAATDDEEDDELIIIVPSDEDEDVVSAIAEESLGEELEELEKEEESAAELVIPAVAAAVGATIVAEAATTTVSEGIQIDEDFVIVGSGGESGMVGLPKPTPTPTPTPAAPTPAPTPTMQVDEDFVIGTGGIIETSEDGTSQVLVSEHSDEEAGKIGTLYDPTKELSAFQRPPIEILEKYDEDGVQYSTDEINENKVLIKQTLDSFGVKIKKITATVGPTVTLYEIEPEMGVKVARIKSLEDDIAISLKAMSIRLIVPMPGRGTIGIEIPNRTRRTVSMYSVIKSKKFQESKAALPGVIGKTIQNETFIFDLAEMPHMIVAGATGQGKSVGLNAIIASLIYKRHPAELKFVMVDPKKVELSLYSKLENHYLAKMESEEEAILTDTQKVVYTLNSLCNEMEERYKLLRAAGVKRIDAYNQKFLERKLHPKYGHRYLPYLVVVIDEFADMIMTAGKEVETPIVRLGQLARAIGIHLIIATQRPDAKVITGLISANCPARIAFKVTYRIISQIIVGGTGAEKLIGKCDMLVKINGVETRLQCAFIDTPEIERITDFVAHQRGYSSAYLLPDYVPEDGGVGEPKEEVGDLDSMFEEVARFVVGNQQGSTSFVQRKFKIGYNRAGRIMDQLEAYGIVGRSEGGKPREVLISDPSSLEKLLNDIFIENL